MDYLFGVNFQSQEKLQYFLVNYQINKGDLVICESLKGIELGRVATNPKEYIVKEGEEIPFSYIIRLATEEDQRIFDNNKKEANDALKIVQLESNKLNLNMKVLSAEYTLDQSKLTVSYLADDRVDFRELLKVLASLYHCRIELRQIGPRDKAKMIGGIGICGLPLCCATFLNEFDGISINRAKNQMLSLNIPKLSGHCGKLICCLKYEDETYTDLKKDFPKIGTRLIYNNEQYRISSMNVLTRTIKIENADDVQFISLDEVNKCLKENKNAN